MPSGAALSFLGLWARNPKPAVAWEHFESLKGFLFFYLEVLSEVSTLPQKVCMQVDSDAHGADWRLTCAESDFCRPHCRHRDPARLCPRAIFS